MEGSSQPHTYSVGCWLGHNRSGSYGEEIRTPDCPAPTVVAIPDDAVPGCPVRAVVVDGREWWANDTSSSGKEPAASISCIDPITGLDTVEESLSTLGIETRFVGRLACSPITLTFRFFLERIPAAFVLFQDDDGLSAWHAVWFGTYIPEFQMHLLRPFSEYYLCNLGSL